MITVKLLKPWLDYARDTRLPCNPDFAVQLVNLGVAEIADAAVLAQLQAQGKLKAPAPEPEPEPETEKDEKPKAEKKPITRRKRKA